MSHTNTQFSIGMCSKEYENDLQNAYLFGYLTALEDRLEKLEDRAEKIERVFRDLLDFDDDDEEEDDDSEDDEDEIEVTHSHYCCFCFGLA